MKSATKHIGASLFGLIIIAFIFPFVIVSCPGHGQVPVTGAQLSFGTTIKGSQLSSVSSDRQIKPQPLAFLALGCAAAGIIFSYLKTKDSSILCLAAAIAGLAFLLLLRNQIVT
jgi:hypothetical protein